MLRGKRILVAEDNDWIAAALIQTIIDYCGIALGPAQTNVSALALIDGHLDGAILDGNLLDGPITPKPEKIPASPRGKRRGGGSARRAKPSGPKDGGGEASGGRSSVPKVPLVKV